MVKLIVFDLLKRQGKVYTEIVSDCSKATSQGIIRENVELNTVIYSDSWRGYDDLADIDFDKHFLVHHGENEFASGNGVAKHTFYLNLKETEFRFNHRHNNLYLEILKLLRNKLALAS